MYVYVTDRGNIILRTKERNMKMRIKYREFIVNYDMTDNLIYEWGEIKKYENSRQYIEDTNRYHLTKELNEEKRKNADLVKIANTKVRQDMELDIKGQEANEYQRKLYLLRNMRHDITKESTE